MKKIFFTLLLFVSNLLIFGQTYTKYHPDQTFEYLESESHNILFLNGLLTNGYLNNKSLKDQYDNNIDGIKNYINTKTYSFWNNNEFYMISFEPINNKMNDIGNWSRTIFLYRLDKNNKWNLSSDSLHIGIYSYERDIKNSYFGSKEKKDINMSALKGSVIKHGNTVEIKIICFTSNILLSDKPKYYYLTLLLKENNKFYSIIDKKIKFIE